jgi:hypothetical protein
VRAARLMGAADRIRRALGTRLLESLFFRAEHEQCVRQARCRLGDDRYEAAFREGGGLGLDDAIAYALGDNSARGSGRSGQPGPW